MAGRSLQAQRKIERRQLTLKNRPLFENSYLPGALGNEPSPPFQISPSCPKPSDDGHLGLRDGVL